MKAPDPPGRRYTAPSSQPTTCEVKDDPPTGEYEPSPFQFSELDMLCIPTPPDDHEPAPLIEYLDECFAQFVGNDEGILKYYIYECLQPTSIWEFKQWITAPYDALSKRLGQEIYFEFQEVHLNLRIIWEYLQTRTGSYHSLSYGDFLDFKNRTFEHFSNYYPAVVEKSGEWMMGDKLDKEQPETQDVNDGKLQLEDTTEGFPQPMSWNSDNDNPRKDIENDLWIGICHMRTGKLTPSGQEELGNHQEFPTLEVDVVGKYAYVPPA